MLTMVSRIRGVNHGKPHPRCSVSSRLRMRSNAETVAGMVGVRLRVLQAAIRQRAAGSSKAPTAKKKKGEVKVVPVVAKEIREKVTLGANTLKTGADPPILDDSAYPPWLWGLLDKRPALGELERRDPETLNEKEIMILLKLDNRRRIKENNSMRSKE